jgi:DNA polymerase-1
MRIVLSNLRNTNATHCAVVFDGPGKNHRHELFPDYKAGRVKHPEVREALNQQQPIIVKLCRAMGLRVFGKKNVEGDDLVGQLAYEFVREFDDLAYVLSGDKDFGQLLVNKQIRLINPSKGTIRWSNIAEVFGVPARQVVDYLMMEGDSIDNIPGVRGIGSVTALKLLSDYRRVEDIPASAFPKWARENYAEVQEQFVLTRQLLTLKMDVLKDYDLNRLKRNRKDKDELADICNAFGLTRLRADLTAF